MKKKLFPLFFLISSKCFCQLYIAFPDSNAWWTADVNLNITFPYSPMVQYYIDGDTLINSFQYHKVFSFDTVSNYPSYTAAFRQDTLAKKIYMVDWFASTEYLAYDFSLSVGDTFALDSLTLFQVYAVDSIQVQGQYRKRIRLHGPSGWCLCNCDPDWVEGIGSMYGFRSVDCFELGYVALRCFGINNQTIYPDTGSCYRYFPTGLTNDITLKQEVTIYPNPTTGKITLDFNDNIIADVSIELFSIAGQRIFYSEQKRASDHLTLELKSLDKGIYFLQLTREGKEYRAKVILE